MATQRPRDAPLQRAARLLLGPDQATGGIASPGSDWRWPEAEVAPSGARLVLWRDPLASGAAPQSAARHAAQREVGLRRLRGRPPGGLEVVAQHRIAPAQWRTGPRARLRSRLLSGAMVELAPRPAPPRVVDVTAQEAGLTARPGHLVVGSGGTVLVRGSTWADGPVVIRNWHDATRHSAAATAALRALARAGVQGGPRLLAQGRVGAAHWVMETAIPGTRPRRLSAGLLADVVRFCASLPVSGSSVSLRTATEGLAELLPAQARLLRAIARSSETELGSWPAVAAHGDLWVGNLLVERTRLRGVVDWDAFNTEGVPGVDLLHLLCMEQAMRSRTSVGAVSVTEPWRSTTFRAATADYWAALGLRPTDGQLAAVGAAWWLSQTWSAVCRTPGLLDDPAWLVDNVMTVMARMHVA